MCPESKRVGALIESACEGYREIPVRAVPLERDSVSRFDPGGRVWVVKAERLNEKVGVPLAWLHRSLQVAGL